MTGGDDSVMAALVAALPDGVLVIDAAARIERANAAAAQLLGHPLDALVGRPVAELYLDPAEAHERTLADRAGVDGRPTPREWRTSAGARRVLLVSSRVLGDRVGLVLRDPEDLGDMVERLLRTAASFRAVIENAPDCVIIHTRGRITYANQMMLQMWRGPLEQLVGRAAIDLVHPDDHPLVVDRMRGLAEGGSHLPFIDERLVRSDGTVFLAQVGAVPIAFDGEPAVMVVARDVTEVRQRQLRGGQIDRMVALGTLAAGVAHEIGNPLTYLLLRLDAATVRAGELRSALPPGTPAAPVLDELVGHLAAIADGARRVRTIVGELRQFARPDDEPTVLDVTAPIERALKIAGHALAGIEIERAYAAAPPVLIAEGKLTQVALNLLINAGHAIRAAGGGGHRIGVRVWRDGRHTCFAISDTGVGIAPGDLPRVFDPFFSTKPVGEGIGLGLATAQSIVASASGRLTVASVPGAGATFTVALPAS
ncbi:MAG: PAS domain S-box protein [Myxococcales bacterium]|nr:PAS domain S-box protein [Myxococcales bacterium]